MQKPRISTPLGLTSPTPSDRYFDFIRPTNSVRVNKIPPQVHRREVTALFSTLAGQIRSYQDVGDSGTLEITFCNRDAATKALCMNGYTVSGAALSVTPINTTLADTKQNADDRRNLYVLGLPFALTKNEFASLFSHFGTVSHCVILATVDNSSRRRGFVVMSTHGEAKQALIALTRTQLKGHTIDVSWAVVQRSQGFLDGGDRAMLLDARSHVHTSGASHHDRRSFPSSDSSDSSSGSNEPDPATLKASSMPTSSLLVSNLPTLLFSQIQDLHPLFYPFGPIEKLEIVHILPSGTMSVIVRYTTSTIAQEAKEALHGQRYGINQLEVRFVQTSTTVVNCDPSCDFIPSARDSAAYLHSHPRTHAHFLLGPTASLFQHDNQKTCGFSRSEFMHESLFSSPASPPSFSVLRDHNSSRSCLINSRWSGDSLQRNQGFAVGHYPAFAEEACFTGYSYENFPA